jgi:hypothetical protein
MVNDVRDGFDGDRFGEYPGAVLDHRADELLRLPDLRLAGSVRHLVEGDQLELVTGAASYEGHVVSDEVGPAELLHVGDALALLHLCQASRGKLDHLLRDALDEELGGSGLHSCSDAGAGDAGGERDEEQQD